MLRQNSILSFATLLFVLVSACRSSSLTPTLLPTPTDAPSTEVPASDDPGVIPTATDFQLPFNPTVERGEYCVPPAAALPVEDGNDISEDQIVYELMNIWLRRYASETAPDFCRIDGFTIEKVYYDPSLLNQPLEPRGDFMRMVEFSIKLIQIPNAWMSFSGEVDQENWMHLSQAVSISETSEGYKLDFAYP